TTRSRNSAAPPSTSVRPARSWPAWRSRAATRACRAERPRAALPALAGHARRGRPAGGGSQRLAGTGGAGPPGRADGAAAVAPDWRLDAEDGGRPWLEGPDGQRLHASISHSGERLAVAVALRPIGVDIEVPRRERDLLALARHVFAPCEVEGLLALGEADRL